MKTVALIGAGQRGTIYANYVAENKDTTLCALVEPDAQRRATAQALYHLDDTKVAMATLQGQYSTKNNLLMAASVLSTAPMMVLFAIGQIQLISGIAVSGMKG